MPETACPISDVPSLAEQWARLAAWRRLRNDPPADLDPWSVENMDRFVSLERRAFDLMDGKSLLHTDLQSLNILMDPAVRIVDWAWSRLGAPWVDTALLVIRLIDAGHSPAEAELWADTVSPWTTASSDARTAFSVAVLGAWEYLQRARPLPHRAQLTAAARQWTRHRLTQSEHA
jgi:hypothetical protein